MTRVYADMVADLFHYGHVEFLRQISELGDYVVVGIHSNEVVESYKRTPILSMEERMACVAGCRYVNEVIPNAPLQPDADWIAKHNIDLIAHGDDASDEMQTFLYKVPMEMGIYKTVPYTESISTTEIIRRCKEL